MTNTLAKTGGNFACACVHPLDYSCVIAGIYLEGEVKIARNRVTYVRRL